jgi:heme exporter protein CcmD
MIDTLLGTQYGGFIASSFAISATVLIALILWVWLTFRSRRKALKALDDAGFGRNG